MFDLFDVETEHGRVYHVLVTAPNSSVPSIAAETGLPETRIAELLGDLERTGTAEQCDPDGGAWEAVRPDIVAAGVLRRYEDHRTRMHEIETGLTEAFRFARLADSGHRDIETIAGTDELFHRYRTIQQRARTQVRSIDRPPYYWDEAEILRQEHIQSTQMAAGIGYRTIYQESQSDSPIRNAGMRRTIACGENARVLADPPVKLTIIDSETAIIALDPPPAAAGELVSLLVRDSALLTVLVNVFESLWRLAVPVNLSRLNQELSERDQQILTLMAGGASDDAIARRLGLSRRTIVRHVGQLLEHMGATTRFQAGAQAARRGWL